jgi:hypothetical protein
VRAIAGYVFDPAGRRFVVSFRQPQRTRARVPLDLLVQWVYDHGHDAAPRRPLSDPVTCRVSACFR